ncbi:MAG: polysaccharide deacetylase family protein [Phycisphaerales bacterium]|nr:MAG: polysaccharide deacetylase family protein [Phycisphaerales bacterium]
MDKGKRKRRLASLSGWSLLALMMLAGGSSVMHGEERTYAERLRWPAGTKAVIFHVDDAGMSHDSNMGARQAVEEGVATSLSVMMPCSWVPECAAWLQEQPQVDAGVHLTLTSEWKHYRWGPVAGPSVVPGLVDEHGYLYHDVAQVVAHASPDEFEAEIRAQVDKAIALGIRPTHLDSHMGTCFQPQFIQRYVEVGIEKGIPVMMVGGHMQHIGAEAGAFEPLLHALAAELWNAGLPVLDDLVTQPTKAKEYEQRKSELIALLREMKPGITQIIVHCTDPTEVFSHISGSGAARQAELRLMTDPDVKAFIESEGIVLTNWRELKERRDG